MRPVSETSPISGAVSQLIESAIRPQSIPTMACKETMSVDDAGLSTVSQIIYAAVQTSCKFWLSLLTIKSSTEILTIISTELARMFASQKRGRTASIRHLLSKMTISASWTKSIRTKMKTIKGNRMLNPICSTREKPLAGLILAISGRIVS